MKTSALLTLGLLLAAADQPARGACFSARPLIAVSYGTPSLLAETGSTTVVIDRDGTTEIFAAVPLVLSPELVIPGPAQITCGVARPSDLAALEQALADAFAGLLQGACGSSDADAMNYDVTWYGRRGRANRFVVGGQPLGCPAGVVALVTAFRALVENLPAQPYSSSPLLAVSYSSESTIGDAGSTRVVIFRNGSAQITAALTPLLGPLTLIPGPAQLTRGTAAPSDLEALRQALAGASVGFLSGACGSSHPAGAIDYDITWYGRGARVNRFVVGGQPAGCPPGVSQLLDALQTLMQDLPAQPGAQTFPPPASPP